MRPLLWIATLWAFAAALSCITACGGDDDGDVTGVDAGHHPTAWA